MGRCGGKCSEFEAMRTGFLLLLGCVALAAQPVDVFLLAGQSNMAGRGVVSEADRRPIAGVYAFTKEGKWAPAVDPIHYDRPDRTGVGLARGFARTLLELKAGEQIGVVPAAFGGSALAEWQPGTTHFANAVARVKAALAAAPGARLRGILWHQGEADAGDEERALTYRVRWLKMMTALRQELGAEDVPVVVGELGRFVEKDKYPYWDRVNEELALLPLRAPHVGWVSSEGLRDKGDLLHFDSDSLAEFGRRYALEWMSLRGKK
jgi:hypothetical protein